MSSLSRIVHPFFVLNLIFLFLNNPYGAYAKAGPQQGTTPSLPQLVVSNIRTDSINGKIVLSFAITQEAQTAQSMQVPILITTGVGTFHFTRGISGVRTELSFALPDPPLQIIIDPDHKCNRELTPSEISPTWSRFLKAEKITVVLNPEESAIYAPLTSTLPNTVKIVSPDQVNSSLTENTTLLFLAADNSAARGLFGKPHAPRRGFSLEVSHNPLAPGYLTAWAVSSSKEQTAAALGVIRQDGNVSSIRVKNGKVLQKSKRKADSGQIYTLEQLPAGAPTSAISSFSKIIDKLSSYRVVYVGETHNSPADHLLQFRIIQALYKKHPDLAIGMEMFPRESQKALDGYTTNDTGMSENVFLKKSRYFKTWGYDFRLFRDIFNFAHTYRIPVVALNLDRHIVSEIFKTGSITGLKPEEKLKIPRDRDLSMPGYADRLRKIMDIHTEEMKKHGTTGGFIKAQAVWDETMAKNIAQYLTRHPRTRMVVLAGIEHIRKDSGIPPRVARYLRLRQASVVNITSQDQYSNIADIADYFFMESAPSLPPRAKMGMILEEKKKGTATYLQIDGFSPHGNAGKSGLQKHDILLAIDKNPVYDMDDVRIAMLDKKAGDVVTVTVERKDTSNRKQKLLFKIKTGYLQLDHMHPR